MIRTTRWVYKQTNGTRGAPPCEKSMAKSGDCHRPNTGPKYETTFDQQTTRSLLRDKCVWPRHWVSKLVRKGFLIYEMSNTTIYNNNIKAK